MNHIPSCIYLRKGFTLTPKNPSRSWSIGSELRAWEPIRVRDWGYNLKPNLCFCLATSFCLSSHSSLKIIWQSNILYFHSFLRIFEITKFHSLEMPLMAYLIQFSKSNPDSVRQRYPMDLSQYLESIKLHLILVLVLIKSQIDFLFPKCFGVSFEQAFELTNEHL